MVKIGMFLAFHLVSILWIDLLGLCKYQIPSFSILAYHCFQLVGFLLYNFSDIPHELEFLQEEPPSLLLIN